MRIRRQGLFAAIAFAALGLLIMTAKSHWFSWQTDRTVVLNDVRDEINATFGRDENGTPGINCGPCGRFAIAFREQWNARFREKVNIACVMSPDRKECGHVVVKFADGRFFDGGNGLITEETLRTLIPSECSIEEMVEFDWKLLDERVGGLYHEHYSHCPNYSDQLTGEIIGKHLARLASDIDATDLAK